MNESHIHFELEKLEEEKQKPERGAGLVGREWILSLVMVFFCVDDDGCAIFCSFEEC